MSHKLLDVCSLWDSIWDTIWDSVWANIICSVYTLSEVSALTSLWKTRQKARWTFNLTWHGLSHAFNLFANIKSDKHGLIYGEKKISAGILLSH